MIDFIIALLLIYVLIMALVLVYALAIISLTSILHILDNHKAGIC